MRPTPGPAGTTRPRAGGFTLLEVVIVIAVLGILAAVALPNYGSHTARQRLRAAAEQLEQDLRRAREVAVNESQATFVSFRTGPQWCWGASRQGPCDCSGEAARCELGQASWQDFKGTLLQSGQDVSFEAGRGRALGWSRVALTNEHAQQLYVDLGPLGRPQVCGADARKGSC